MTKRGLVLSHEALEAILAKRPHVHASPDPRVTGRAHEQAKKLRKPASYLEEMLEKHLAWSGLPQAWVREAPFDPKRRWRIDFAWPGPMLAVEIQGEVHRIKQQFDRDILKIQALCFAGWRYLPISSADIRSGRALELIERALRQTAV